MIKRSLAKLVEKTHLSEEEAYSVMKLIMEGGATESQIAAYMTALRMKGETVAEIVGSAKAMREKAIRITSKDRLIVDTCGTGGDQKGTFNISTTSAFVIAGAGLTVAKHGNRSVSSSCGSADVLKSLGVNIDLSPEKVETLVNTIGIGFLFAPLYHESMKHAKKPRQEVGIRTIFNILGPLTNPASATIQVLGVYQAELTELAAKVLISLGTEHCFVVHGMDGLDEITLTDKTLIAEGYQGKVKTYTIAPEDFGFKRCKLSDLEGGSAELNAKFLLEVLKGVKGPKRDIVLLNAAPALVAAGKAGTFQEAISVAAESIDSGKALQKLQKLIECSNQ
ncbi:MAG: anthranilate phosphoribosyltransferase [Nitrospirae bacterium]|nr:anthranilate phosphoribosyltransferase [Nitrospirota bacterium]MBI3351806.1 anthranilate phosphoribosyltransferase [Nitrospirota bacterium]